MVLSDTFLIQLLCISLHESYMLYEFAVECMHWKVLLTCWLAAKLLCIRQNRPSLQILENNVYRYILITLSSIAHTKKRSKGRLCHRCKKMENKKRVFNVFIFEGFLFSSRQIFYFTKPTKFRDESTFKWWILHGSNRKFSDEKP